MLSLVISPLLAGICLMLLPVSYRRICPFCKEGIRADAIVCKHCHRDLPQPQAQQLHPLGGWTPPKPRPPRKSLGELHAEWNNQLKERHKRRKNQ